MTRDLGWCLVIAAEVRGLAWRLPVPRRVRWRGDRRYRDGHRRGARPWRQTPATHPSQPPTAPPQCDFLPGTTITRPPAVAPSPQPPAPADDHPSTARRPQPQPTTTRHPPPAPAPADDHPSPPAQPRPRPQRTTTRHPCPAPAGNDPPLARQPHGPSPQIVHHIVNSLLFRYTVALTSYSDISLRCRRRHRTIKKEVTRHARRAQARYAR
jgi:hypothetical protein